MLFSDIFPGDSRPDSSHFTVRFTASSQLNYGKLFLSGWAVVLFFAMGSVFLAFGEINFYTSNVQLKGLLVTFSFSWFRKPNGLFSLIVVIFLNFIPLDCTLYFLNPTCSPMASLCIVLCFLAKLIFLIFLCTIFLCLATLFDDKNFNFSSLFFFLSLSYFL